MAAAAYDTLIDADADPEFVGPPAWAMNEPEPAEVGSGNAEVGSGEPAVEERRNPFPPMPPGKLIELFDQPKFQELPYVKRRAALGDALSAVYDYAAGREEFTDEESGKVSQLAQKAYAKLEEEHTLGEKTGEMGGRMVEFGKGMAKDLGAAVWAGSGLAGRVLSAAGVPREYQGVPGLAAGADAMAARGFALGSARYIDALNHIEDTWASDRDDELKTAVGDVRRQIDEGKAPVKDPVAFSQWLRGESAKVLVPQHKWTAFRLGDYGVTDEAGAFRLADANKLEAPQNAGLVAAYVRTRDPQIWNQLEKNLATTPLAGALGREAEDITKTQSGQVMDAIFGKGMSEHILSASDPLMVASFLLPGTRAAMLGKAVAGAEAGAAARLGMAAKATAQALPEQAALGAGMAVGHDPEASAGEIAQSAGDLMVAGTAMHGAGVGIGEGVRALRSRAPVQAPPVQAPVEAPVETPRVPGRPTQPGGELPTGPAEASNALLPDLTRETPTDPAGTVPEAPETLQAQADMVVAGTRPAMLVPGAKAAELAPELQPRPGDGTALHETPAGTFRYHTEQIDPMALDALVAADETGLAIGLSEGAKPPGADRAVTLRAEDGTELAAEGATAETAPAAAEALARQSLEPARDTVSVEAPGEVIGSRMSEVGSGRGGEEVAARVEPEAPAADVRQAIEEAPKLTAAEVADRAENAKLRAEAAEKARRSRIAQKGAGIPDHPTGGRDILNDIADNGGIYLPPPGEGRRGGDQDAMAEVAKILPPRYRSIFNRSPEAQRVDQMAQELHGRGALKDGYAETLKNAILEAYQGRLNVRNQLEAGRGAEKQVEAFAREVVDPAKTRRAKLETVQAGELSVGDRLEAGGETFRVTDLDPDTGALTMEDGPKFGTQKVAPEEVLWVEATEAKESTAGLDAWDAEMGKAEGGRGGLELETQTPESVMAERVAAEERAQREAQRDELEQRRQAPLTGDSSEVGQGTLFEGDRDLFSGPSAEGSGMRVGEEARQAAQARRSQAGMVDPEAIRQGLNEAGKEAQRIADELGGGAGAPARKVEEPRLVEAFGPEWPADKHGMPEPPKTLPDNSPLLEPTLHKETATLKPDHVLVRGGYLTAGTHPRSEFRRAALDHFFDQGTPLKPGERPVVLMTGGGGGAGKSSSLKAMREEGVINDKGYVEINADLFKEITTEYHDIAAAGDGRGAGTVHAESSLLAKEALGRALDPRARPRYNITYDGTLSDLAKDTQRIRDFKARGYKVQLALVTIDPAEALVRAGVRAKDSWRYVGTEILAAAHKGFNAGVKKLIDLVDQADLYDNTTKGAQPALIAQKRAGESIRILREDLYNQIDERAVTDPLGAARTGPDPGRQAAEAGSPGLPGEAAQGREGILGAPGEEPGGRVRGESSRQRSERGLVPEALDERAADPQGAGTGLDPGRRLAAEAAEGSAGLRGETGQGRKGEIRLAAGEPGGPGGRREGTARSAGETDAGGVAGDAPAKGGMRVGDEARQAAQERKNQAGMVDFRAIMQGLGEAGKEARRFVDELGDIPKFTPFREAVNTWVGTMQRSALSTQDLQKAIEREVPDARRREAVTNYVQAGGDMTKLQAWEAASTGERRLGYEAAQSLTPAELAVAARTRKFYDEAGALATKEGVLKGWHQDYVNKVWKDRMVSGKKVGGGAGAGKLSRSFVFGKRATHANFFEGEQDGLVPATKDVSKLMGIYLHELHKTIATRKLIKDLTTRTASDGRPLAAPLGGVVPQPGTGGAGKSNVMVLPSMKGKVRFGANVAGKPNMVEIGDYQRLNHPALAGWRFLDRDPNTGKITVTLGELAVHPEVHAHMKNALGESGLRQWAREPGNSRPGRLLRKGFTTVDHMQSFMKQAMLSLSPFHIVQEGTHAIGHKVNPFYNIPRIDPENPKHADAMNHGLMLGGDEGAMRNFQEAAGHAPAMERIPGIGPIMKAITDFTFHTYIPGLKIKTYEHIVKRNTARLKDELAAGEVTEADVKYMSARQTNSAYGHLNYKDLGRNPGFQHAMRLLLLAPDFLEARTRFAANALNPTKAGREQTVAYLTLGVTMYVAARTLNAALNNGDAKWNEWREPFTVFDGNRKYTMRSVPEDTVKMFLDPRKFIAGRISPLVGTGLMQAITGRNYRGEKMTWGEQVHDTLARSIPLSTRMAPGLRDLTESTKNHPVSPWEQFMGAMGLHISRYSPINEVTHKAGEFAKHSGFPNVGVYPLSPYRNLRHALEDQDWDRAAQEIKALRSKGQDDKKLQQGFKRSTFHPYTGKNRLDVEFAKTLKGEDRHVYQLAQRRRLDVWNRFARMTGAPRLDAVPVPQVKED